MATQVVKVVFPAVLARYQWFSGTRSDVFITFGKNSTVAQIAAQYCASRIFAVKWGHPSLTPLKHQNITKHDIISQHSDILAMCGKVVSSFVIFAVLDLRVCGCRP